VRANDKLGIFSVSLGKYVAAAYGQFADRTTRGKAGDFSPARTALTAFFALSGGFRGISRG
jgi:hypothetical protein